MGSKIVFRFGRKIHMYLNASNYNHSFISCTQYILFIQNRPKLRHFSLQNANKTLRATRAGTIDRMLTIILWKLWGHECEKKRNIYSPSAIMANKTITCNILEIASIAVYC